MEYKDSYSSFDVGMSYLNDKKYYIMNRGLEKVLADLGFEDMKVVCRETISKNEFMPEKERFQVIVGKKFADWEKILKEN